MSAGKVAIPVTLRVTPELAAWLHDFAAEHGNTVADELAVMAGYTFDLHGPHRARCPRGHVGFDLHIHARFATDVGVTISCRTCEMVYLRKLSTGQWLRIPEAA